MLMKVRHQLQCVVPRDCSVFFLTRRHVQVLFGFPVSILQHASEACVLWEEAGAITGFQHLWRAVRETRIASWWDRLACRPSLAAPATAGIWNNEEATRRPPLPTTRTFCHQRHPERQGSLVAFPASTSQHWCLDSLGAITEIMSSSCQKHPRPACFLLSLFYTVPLHSLKYNSQRLNRRMLAGRFPRIELAT